jgi:hypothetical protein
MCKESQTTYATISICAAKGCLEKSYKIIIAQVWLKTSSVFLLGVASARNHPLHKIILAKRVFSCGVRVSVPPDTVNAHSAFAGT